MKKIFSKISILAFVCVSVVMISSCQSTNQTVKTSSDLYVNDEDGENEGGESRTALNNSKTSEEKKKFNFAEAFFGKKFIDLDEFSVSTPTVTFGIKQKVATFVYGVKTKRFGFGAPYMAAYYFLTFDDAGRQNYIKAVESYLKDFEDKKLDRKSKKTEKIYGYANARLDWGSIKSSTPNNGEGSAYLGYTFKDKSPYFTITIYPVGNEKRLAGDDSADTESLLLHFYFTKAQAKQLAEFLSDENVSKVFIEEPHAEDEEVESVGDDY
ncbi:MAG: hypothetical protein K6A43_10155 [Treponema sp.]|nr:hypothetical protein [Treponema sp.]